LHLLGVSLSARLVFVLAPPYFCASCACRVEDPTVIDGIAFHRGDCLTNYLLDGPTYHHSYLQDLHLIALYDLDALIAEPVLNPPPPLTTSLCADCGIRTTEGSSCVVCSFNLCIGCQDRHRNLLHRPLSS
jgi:hypothetical protein